jgi:hypothetical protein
MFLEGYTLYIRLVHLFHTKPLSTGKSLFIGYGVPLIILATAFGLSTGLEDGGFG